MRFLCVPILLTSLLIPPSVFGDGPDVGIFVQQIRPLLAKHCLKCHGPEKQESGLRLDSSDGVRRGGDSGPIVVAKVAKESRLLIAVRGGTDEIGKMPPEGPPLSADEIAILERWIELGAELPQGENSAIAKSDHWSFRRPTRPALPFVKNESWVREPIDRFILEKLEAAGLAPSPAAERATLIRRVSLDLLGLPPSPESVELFVNDDEPDAVARLVDQLLASPAYGERWGRHWLDAARYADSNGYTRDGGREIWKYREWVITAFNANLPFDQFTVEQFAGDLLQNAANDQIVATGFHRNTLVNEEGGTDQEQFRIDAVADRLATTGEVFLGLTIGCARCHSHKYDPITQREYYQLFAFLNNCDEPSIEAPSDLQVLRGDLPKRADIRRQIAALEQKLEELRPELEKKQQEWEATVTPQQRARLPGPIQVAYDMKFAVRDKANKKTLEDHYKKTDQGRKDFPLLDEIAMLRDSEPKIPTTLVMRERTEPRKTHVHRRGDFLDLGDEVTPAVPSVLPSLPVKDTPATRLDLARWLVDPANPLTSRVIVNRFWNNFFGHGLVETDNDFGTQGSPPSHPKLLDWLAVEFVDSGWDIKRLHRMIVCSATYQQSSQLRSPPAVDPENKLLWRQNRLRLEAEIIRDVALAASGLLTRKIGGPSVQPPQPDGIFEFTQDPKPWKAATGEDRFRRGMYTQFWRSLPYPALMVFDAPNGNVTCTRRLRSNTPLQALTMANDQQFIECAQALARRIVKDSSADPAKRADEAFRTCLARAPTSEELARLQSFVNQQLKALEGQPAASAELAGKTAEPSTAIELAAWTTTARVLMNLDEFITRE